KQSRTIPFTVTVPTAALPGQYLAAVSISVPASSTTSATPHNGNQAGFAITLQTQRVIAVEVDVPGPRAPHLVVRSVKPVVQANILRLQFDVTNAGNAFAKGSGTLTVPDTNTRLDFPVNTFVPHTSIKLPLAWTKDVVPGVHPVSLRLQDQTGRIVTWTGSVDVSGAVGAALERTLSAAKGAHLGSHPSKGTSSSSYDWLALLLIPICIAAAVHMRRRRSVSAPTSSRNGRRPRGFTSTPPRDRDVSPDRTESKVETNASR
ncbi:MAG TPA: hypothetical protein VGI86_08130, partial [Acidimicrobiia bacterium]